jgi:uncharacterized protein YpmB
VQASPSTQPVAQQPTDKTNDAADTWTTVQTNGKTKGKGVKEVSSATDITCSNGFEPHWPMIVAWNITGLNKAGKAREVLPSPKP